MIETLRGEGHTATSAQPGGEISQLEAPCRQELLWPLGGLLSPFGRRSHLQECIWSISAIYEADRRGNVIEYRLSELISALANLQNQDHALWTKINRHLKWSRAI
jgi:hypothetical protein